MKVDIIDYFDVWGNEQDGWEVNDVIRYNVEVNNMEDIWDKLIENRIISADAEYEDFFVCDWEDGRGYYVYAQPVKRGVNSISFTLFSGFKQIVESVERKSKKAEQRTEIFAEQNALDFARKLAERENFELDLEV